MSGLNGPRTQVLLARETDEMDRSASRNYHGRVSRGCWWDQLLAHQQLVQGTDRVTAVTVNRTTFELAVGRCAFQAMPKWVSCRPLADTARDAKARLSKCLLSGWRVAVLGL
jgi:hypothetical protein